MTKQALRGEHALKINISTDLKMSLENLAKTMDRPLADVCRILLWMGLPVLEGIDEARRRGTQLCTLWDASGDASNADQKRQRKAREGA